jgi:NAD(P)-dependent dehydrogenase (short-subunit alcohol dehydrogenase family)
VLSLTKAAQRNLTESLAKVYGPQGVHVGLIIVGGPVAPENKKLNPAHIAERTWELYGQEKDKWTLEVDIREP